MTSSNGNIFRVTGHLCGEFTGPGEFPAQRPVTRSFDAFFDLRLNKRLSKQPRGWWFQTPSWSLWRQYNVVKVSLTHRPRRYTRGRSRCRNNPKFLRVCEWIHCQPDPYLLSGQRTLSCCCSAKSRNQSGKLKWWHTGVNTLRPRQADLHFPDDIFKCIFLNESV